MADLTKTLVSERLAATSVELDKRLNAILRIPTAVTWNRLEGRPRSDDLARPLRAEVRDPAWMLARQWQLGEFEGQDAGAPILSKLLAETRYVGAPVAVLRGALEGTLRLARGHAHVDRDGFFRLGSNATVAEIAHARRFYECMRRWRQIPENGELESRALASFRPDLRLAALAAVMKRGYEA